MPTPTIENILAIFDEEYSISLKEMTRKRIIYEGKTKHGKSIVVVMPCSKVYDRGNGWVDFTKIQIDIFKQHQIAIAVFSLSNGAKYFIDMNTLFPILTQKNMMTNEIQGEHWKLHIWPDKIVVRKKNGEKLQTKLNEHRFIGQLVGV